MSTADKSRPRLPEWWQPFYSALVISGGNHAFAHYETKTCPKDLDEAIREHPQLVKRLEEVEDILRGKLVESAYSRAVDGWEEPVFYEGEECGTKRKYSDPLLVKLLASYVPACMPKVEDDRKVTPELVNAVLEQLRKQRDGRKKPNSG